MTTRPASTPSEPGHEHPGAPEAKAGEESTALGSPETLSAPDGSQPVRPESTPLAARTVDGTPGGRPFRVALPPGASDEDWHAIRRGGLGGSDIAAVLGLHRWKGPLHVWEEKQGRGDHSDSEAAYCGRKLEGLIAEMFGERTGLHILPSPGTLQNLARPWMLANIDRLVADGGDDEVPLECKNRSEYQARQWAEDVPDEPALQAHWYTAVKGSSHAYVAALIGGNRLRWYRIERDQVLIDHLIEFCEQWWLEHVVEGTPPPPDGSRATTDLLAHLWDAEEGTSTEIDPVESVLLLQRRRELKANIKVLLHDLDEVENQMRTHLATAEVATVGHREVYSWRQNGAFAPARFREAEPELAAHYIRMVPAIDTERLAADHPETYRTYRARVLRTPHEG
ncbi:YqaJ viral recombinase family protein [Streptomyces sp. C10-9-1]|uniref:YqaJ viral recombinase family nuclease n=1 Tax=Streptomyces sp. C10-9-1 TaxID=1859285 RepID=UPI003F49ED7B